MNRPPVNALGPGQSPDQLQQQVQQRLNRIEGGLEAGRYINSTAAHEAATAMETAQNTEAHRFATDLHRQAADQVTLAGPSTDPRVLQVLSGFKRQAMENLGIGAAAAELGAMAAGGVKAMA